MGGTVLGVSGQYAIWIGLNVTVIVQIFHDKEWFKHRDLYAPSGVIKASMLIHTYTHKHLMKIKVTICNHQVNSQLYVWPDVWSGDLQV